VGNSRSSLGILAAWSALMVCVASAWAAAPAPESPVAKPTIQVSGRVIHTWHDEEYGARAILVIDGFTVLTTRGEQLTARDGVIWFDEEAAGKTGRAELGIYAETAVEVKRADGRIEKHDSVYVVLSNGAEVSLRSDEPLRGEADGTPLYLRAKKHRREFLEKGEPEAPIAVVPAPEIPPEPKVPGIREAAVPQEITIVPQDDVRQVNFTSFVTRETDDLGRERDVRVSIWTGGVYVIRGGMEMAADNLVVWMPEEDGEEAGAEEPAVSLRGPSRRLAAEAYFEGHVRMSVGRRVLQASQLYYDFRRDQALAVNTKIRTFSKDRDVPVYYYAKEVRQLAQGIFVGTDAWMTTCEFGHPHYETGARELTLVDLTPEAVEEEEDRWEEEETYRRVRFVGKDVQVRVRHLPLTYWPRLAGDLAEGETALRTIRIENRSNRGTGVVSQWHLFKLLGIEREPPGYDFYLNLDFWSSRGPAIGVEADYDRQDYFGEFESYYLRDTGKDSVGSEDVESPSGGRGRVTWRHRHYLPEDWELTWELSWISDERFLNEFFEREEETEKSQETLIYLKKQENEQALTLLASWRLNDFYTRTEFLPQIGYNVIGHSLLDDRLTYFQDSEVAWARYRPREPTSATDPDERGSHGEFIGDTIHELDLPIRLGPVNVVPFVEGRISYFEEGLQRDGHECRYYGRTGARAAVQAWRVYPGVESHFWDVHSLRHINTFDVRAYQANVSVPSRELIPYDVTEAGTAVWEGVDDTGVTGLGWRQRFQTKRGPPDERATVDWLTLDLEGTFYDDRVGPNQIAPDGKEAKNHLDFRTDWRITDSASLWTDTNYQMVDGTLDLFVVGLTVAHSPRLSYSVGHRYIPDGDSARAFIMFDYRINEKWRLSLFEQYDFDQQQSAQTDFVITRRLHRWIMRVRMQLDPGEDESFVGLEFQPMGVSEVRFGM